MHYQQHNAEAAIVKRLLIGQQTSSRTHMCLQKKQKDLLSCSHAAECMLTLLGVGAGAGI